MGLKDRSTEIKHGLPGHLLGPVPLQTGLESKVSPSHQALLQHLLQKEQMRQQKILSSGKIVPSILFYTLYNFITSFICHEFGRNLIRDFVFLLTRPRLHVITLSVPPGHEGLSLQHSAKTTKTPALEQNPVSTAASEHTGSTCHPAATPALPGETETIPAAGPYK